MKLQNKIGLVTGGTKGIGLAIAEMLVELGVHVAVSARTAEDVSETASRLSARSVSHVIGVPCDVRSASESEELIRSTVQQLGGLDILINNAGVGIFQTVEEMSPDSWRRVIGTNLDSLFYTCHAAVPEMKKRGGGFIVNVGSLAGKNAFPKGAAYNASKFGLVGFSEALMQEVRHDNIQVAYVMPGSVDTWFSGSAPVGEDSWKLSSEDVAQVVVETLSRSDRCLTSRIEVRPSKPPKR